MAREKSSLTKLLEGRCQGRGELYTAWLQANEVSSVGSGFIIPDPIANREVHLLSNAERIVFWQLRFDPQIIEIREQMLLMPKYINEICDSHHYRHPKKIMTTDFLIAYSDKQPEAISVKPNRSVYTVPPRCTERVRSKYRRLNELRVIQKEYWEGFFNTPFREVFADELDHHYSINIERCMRYYNLSEVDSLEHFFCHLVARRSIDVDLTGRYVSFRGLLNEHREDVQCLLSSKE